MYPNLTNLPNLKRELTRTDQAIAELTATLEETLSSTPSNQATSFDSKHIENPNGLLPTASKGANSDSLINFIIKKNEEIELYKKQLGELQKQREKLLGEIFKLTNWIKNINDPELREIVELRVVYQHTFTEIGKQVNMDGSTAGKKYKRFVNGVTKLNLKVAE